MIKRIIGKLLKSVATSSVLVIMCIRRAIRKQYLRNLYKLHYLSKQLCRKSTECPKQNSWNGIDNSHEECVVPMDPFSLVGIGIYKWLFTSDSKVIIELVETHLEDEKWAANLQKRVTKHVVLTSNFDNGVFRA